MGFKFEPFWLTEEECEWVIESAWGESVHPNAVSDLCMKLYGYARKIEVWSKERFGSLGKSINTKRTEIKSLILRAKEAGISKEIARAEGDLENLLTKDEMYWRHRSRADCLADGDRNSQYFHRKASARKKRNWIEMLEDEDGKKASDEGGISEIAHRKFVAEDVHLAVFNIWPTKAPGLDGFHALFFQKFWKIVGVDVSRFCLKVLNGESSIRPFNKTNVVLIPKIKSPMNIRDFRPISLCSVVYKIVRKTMANCLKGILSDIISHTQSAFMPKRLIFDNVLVAFELLHSIGNRKKGKRGFWIDLVLDCIFTSTIEVFINGKISGEIIPSRGLRQGCPLSPYLFLLCAETLSCLLKNSERDGELLGFLCSRGSPLISHLFFTDDSVLFCKATVATCAEISRVLKVYERGSGQIVNLQKSNITFSPNVCREIITNIQAVFGVGDANTHDKYLGLPTLVGRNKKKTFNEIKDRIWRRIRGWESDLFSFGGKEVLIKAIPRFQADKSEGIRWKVGDGTSIRAFVDPWIPRPSSFKPITASIDKLTTVADFLSNDGCGWNLGKLELQFLEIDRNDIPSIPLGLGRPVDKLL
ncbi:hypothetical protein Dsin_021330 [Dipteronia sinensis]|uniref:Reverse transcriptase domain-containing protein n=1 Tax=Dipteronia sinensis TaxID=43782 RepID=A0AAD9ZZZ0_9ROSI|nr:hypothetical protein Dsin_021330 [Dipteronia sinensis]